MYATCKHVEEKYGTRIDVGVSSSIPHHLTSPDKLIDHRESSLTPRGFHCDEEMVYDALGIWYRVFEGSGAQIVPRPP